MNRFIPLRSNSVGQNPSLLSGRWFAILLGTAGAMVLPTLFVVDSAAALGRGWEPSGWESVTLVFMLSWLAAILVSLFFRRCRSFWAEGHLVFGIASVLLFATLFLVNERVGTRFPDPHSPLRPARMKMEFEPESDGFPGVRGISRFNINESGLRGRSWPTDRNTQRLLCLGGGTTECLYLDDEEAWPNRLMEEMNHRRPEGNAPSYWLASAGFGGISLDQIVPWVNSSSMIDQVDVVICFLGAEETLREILQTPDLSACEQQPSWRRGGLGRAFSTLIDGIPPMLVRADREGVHHREFIGAIPSRNRGDVRLPAVDHFVVQVRRLAQQLQSKGKRVIFVSQPALWDDFMFELWVRRLRYCKGDSSPEDVPKPTPSLALQTLDQFNQRLAEVCQDLQYEFIDLAPLMNGRADYFYDDIHFSEQGCRVAARVVADYMKNNPTSPTREKLSSPSIRRPVFLAANVPTLLTFRARSKQAGKFEATIRSNRPDFQLKRSFDLDSDWRYFWWPIQVDRESGPAEFFLPISEMDAVEISNFSSARFSAPLQFQLQVVDESQRLFVSAKPDEIYSMVTKVSFAHPIPGGPEAVSLVSGSAPILRGVNYTLRMKLFSPKQRSMRIQCRSASKPSNIIGLDREIVLTPPETNLSIDFPVSESVEDATIMIFINHEPIDFNFMGASLGMSLQSISFDAGISSPPGSSP
ncbi:hypothetical protein K2X85_06530 [bacterium]|nr:hypothetical protein [bacterium]